MINKYFNENLIKNKIYKLSEVINKATITLNKKYCMRNRKLDISKLFYFLCHKNANNLSYNKTNMHCTLSNFFDVTNTSIINKRNLLDYDGFQQVINDLLNHIYQDKKPRIISVDGSQLNFTKNINEDINESFLLSKSKQYKTGLVSSLIDVTNNVPINYLLVNHKDERKAFITQLTYIHKGDILIFDRGYFSANMLKILIDKQVDFIFRIRKNESYSKLLIDKDDLITTITINNVIKKIRIIKFTINSSKQHIKKYRKDKIETETYFILTSLVGKKVSVKYLMDIYHKRWTVETNFRHLKYYASLGRICSKSTKFIKQDIQVHNFLFTLTGYLEHILTSSSNMINKKLNTKLSLNLFTTHTLHHILENKIDIHINKIVNEFVVLFKFQVSIQKDRHYKRETKIPMNYWQNKYIFKR